MSGMTARTTATSAMAPDDRHHQSGHCGCGKDAGMARKSAHSQAKTRETLAETLVMGERPLVTK